MKSAGTTVAHTATMANCQDKSLVMRYPSCAARTVAAPSWVIRAGKGKSLRVTVTTGRQHPSEQSPSLKYGSVET